MMLFFLLANMFSLLYVFLWECVRSSARNVFAFFIFAFDKGERLHSAVAFENFGAFIDTDLAPPEEFLRGEIIQGK